MEEYRSGHNEPHSKCGVGQPTVGSNPTSSATKACNCSMLQAFVLPVIVAGFSVFVAPARKTAKCLYRLSAVPVKHIANYQQTKTDLLDAAIARHLDLMHHYNTLARAIEDKEKYVDTLNDVLRKLRDITETGSNQELIDAVEQLVLAKNSN